MNPHPIRLVLTEDDGRRSRLTVFFRVLLSIPHFVWLYLWAIAAQIAALLAWFAGLVLGRVPGGLHRFIAGYTRYSTHVMAYLCLVANPFPGFTGTAGSYPVEIDIDDPQRQSRLGIFFRILLALPAFMILYVVSAALFLVGFLGWFAALVTGRMPAGLRDLGAYALRYSAQANGYLLLLTGTYPNSSPREEAPAPAPAPTPAL